MDIRTGILQAAQALGIDPVDLATAISYETAGTFDPLKRGPTTQWGQHRGLIQFGEPQARQHGVDWNDPLGSQLGENGAVVRYLKSSGVKPGMGLLDVYSAINAGAPGRYNASDANNGGAPGTVADKVRTQMAGHREKALALMGQAPAQAIPQPSPQAVPQLAGQPPSIPASVLAAAEPAPAPRRDLFGSLAALGAMQQPEPMQLAPMAPNQAPGLSTFLANLRSRMTA